MDATRFCSLREKRIFPWNDVTITSEVGVIYVKMFGAVFRFRGYLQWLSSSTLWSIIASCAKILAQPDLKGFCCAFWDAYLKQIVRWISELQTVILFAILKQNNNWMYCTLGFFKMFWEIETVSNFSNTLSKYIRN